MENRQGCVWHFHRAVRSTWSLRLPEPGAGGPDDLSQRGRLMAAEIVHDDDVAGLEHRNELLLDIGAEAFAIDRAVEDAGRGEAIAAQRADEGQRPPAGVRCVGPQAI